MEDVLNRETEQPVAPPTQGKDPGTEKIERLERELNETRQSERYWAGLAQNGGGGRPVDKAGEEDKSDDASEFVDAAGADGLEGDTPEKMVDELAAQGTSALKKRGFITAADAKKMAAEVAVKVAKTLIGRERGQMTTEKKLMTDFPELADKSSDLYKATAKIYQEAIDLDQNAKNSPAALYLAAKAAKAGMPAGRSDGDGDETEEERRDRARSQDSRPRGRGTVEDQTDSLSSEDREAAAAFGLTEAEFLAARKETMGSRPRGRR